MTLRQRIFRVYEKHTGAPKGEYGMNTWFGQHCGRSRRAVYRWCDENVVSGEHEHLRILRILEALPAGTPWATRPEALSAPLPADFPHRKELHAAGFKSEADVFHAPDEVLLMVSGIGPAAVTKIRGWWQQQSESAA